MIKAEMGMDGLTPRFGEYLKGGASQAASNRLPPEKGCQSNRKVGGRIKCLSAFLEVAHAAAEDVFNPQDQKDYMTQTLRRELIQKFHDLLLDKINIIKNDQELEDLASALADAALSMRAFRPAPVLRGIEAAILGDRPVSEDDLSAEKEMRLPDQIIDELSEGLGFNLPHSPAVQSIARRILSDGRDVKKFIAWAMLPARRSFTFVYARNPENIWIDWPQAFLGDKPAQPQQPNDWREKWNQPFVPASKRKHND